MLGSTRKESRKHDPAEALVREVGAELRQARLQRGETLEEVAELLRIRPGYLAGIEQGDLSVIPGRPYALGFLRSYAQYLGFDGDDLIAQIRSSVADLTAGTHLHRRVPLSESRLPKLPIVVVSLAALAGVYAGWAYVENDTPEVEIVAELPDEFRDPLGVQALEAPRPEIAAVVDDIEPAPPPPLPDVPADEVAPADEAADPVVILPAMSAVEDEVAAVEPEAPAPAPEDVVAVEPPPPQAEAAPPAPEPPAEEVVAALEPVDGASAEPVIYRDGEGSERVILRARSRSWIHVSSTNNDYLWVKTLQPGDAFVVPDRPGLVLWTGNAGGIEVIVDGAPLPPLGPEAGVVRDVSLQPQALLRRLLPAAAAGPSGL
jgi:cytoskeleton protein RodZ